MPRKRRVGRPCGSSKRRGGYSASVRRAMSVRGGNLLGSVGRFIAKNAPKVHKFIKDKKVISSALSLVPHPYAKIASVGAKTLGYGSHRKRHSSNPIGKLRAQRSLLSGGRRARYVKPRIPANLRPIYSGGHCRGGAFVRPLPGYSGRPPYRSAVIGRPKTLATRLRGSGSSRGYYLGDYIQGVGHGIAKTIF